MNRTRRNLILSILGGIGGGCSGQRTAPLTRPGPAWPKLSTRPRPLDSGKVVLPPATADAPGAVRQNLSIIPRSRWTRAQPRYHQLNPMNKIYRITVHHEGAPSPVYFTSYRDSRKRLEIIRSYHIERGWADIGYHYVIDRAGRIWSARSARYQGAHVKDWNEKNLGIMLLGNFDQQKPSLAQRTTLQSALQSSMHLHRVPIRLVHTHQELARGRTRCPGNSLQRYVDYLRRRLA